MAYMAMVPLKFGHNMILPGEEVPIEAGRNYQKMLGWGQISVVPELREEPKRRGRPPRTAVDPDPNVE